MTDRPYTDDDLRAEAARQHKTRAEDPDFMGIGERMQGQEVTPDGGVAWDDFRDETFDAAQRSIHDLINGAAYVSEWAVNLGADGLEPGTRAIDIGWNNGPLMARIHISYAANMPDDEREQLVTDLSNAIAATVPVR